MSQKRFRVVVNGFRVNKETFDDMFEFDGKRDEVFIQAVVRHCRADGTVLFTNTPRTPVMGDVNRLPGRVQAGSASRLGGLVTGDSFPQEPPYIRTLPLAPERDWPPFVVWEGDLVEEQDVVFITPSLWEWDQGKGLLQRFIEGQTSIDDQFGRKAKEIFGQILPAYKWIFDAVSLGIQTQAAVLQHTGDPADRPIGMTRNPDPAGLKYIFDPPVILLTYASAELLTRTSSLGVPGLLTLSYHDDSSLGDGDYTLYVQVEEVTPAQPGQWQHVGHANSVTAMTAVDGRLVCATGDGSLWMREPQPFNVNWLRVGHAYGVTAMASLPGELWCTTNDNGLHVRSTAPVEVPWTRVGHANEVAGLCGGSDGQLYCATRENVLWSRPPQHADIAWTEIGRADNVVSMTATGSDMLAATADGQLWRRPSGAGAHSWTPAGTTPSGVRGIAALNGRLWCATADNRLWLRTA